MTNLANEQALTMRESTREPTTMDVIMAVCKDPAFDAAKLAVLYELREREQKANAEKAFNQAMASAQEEMRPVLRDGKNEITHSKFARLESIDNAIRPIYTKHGFSMSFNSGEPRSATGVRVLCDVRHSDGFVKAYELEGELDNIGAKGAPTKTAIHGLGSSVSYLRRYLTCMIFNITLTNEDDDGNAAGGQHEGWNGSGSQAAADQVAQEKIAAMTAKAPVKRSRAYYMLMESFSDIHKRFNDMSLEGIYYDHLHRVGKNHSNQFTDDAAGFNAARQCFKAMSQELSELEVAAKKATE